MSDRTPSTAACTHEVIQTWGDGTTAVMWSCAAPDCRLRFYPACRECVDIGHRNIVHEARAPLDVERLREAAQEFYDAITEADATVKTGTQRWLQAEAALRAALEEPTPGPKNCPHGVPIAPAWTCGYCAPQYTEDDPDWSAMVSPISEDGGHDER